MRILVVDHEFRSRWAIVDWLAGFLDAVAVESAASAMEAMAVVALRRPDLVLAANPMPEMGGVDLARQLKSQGSPPLVIVMTDQSDVKFESACDSAGADFWLEKRHLQARLAAFLQQRFSLRLAARQRGSSGAYVR
jgi:CheY-like chemotaxis protein